ncbi:phosphoenolpyruvate carboxykinase domain-containing protein, partial [Candidatus Altiarchaeota archaeon]
YVAHSINLLYRQGYEDLKKRGEGAGFFKFIHSQGEVTENNTSKNIEKRRVYIDLEDETVYSMNTQYGGNTLGPKKLAMRLAINRASEEGWLTEHMFLMGIGGTGENKERVTYFTGAFPSLCGKTSTSMMKGETIVGDDIAYLRIIDGVVRSVNVEEGMFGIIMGINSKDDPLIWQALHDEENEVIFSNILVTEEGKVHWIGKDSETPEKGENYAGEWWPGKMDGNNNEMPPSHKNARFTFNLKNIGNADPKLNDPAGVEVGGIIYGGRDSDTWMPVRESFNWVHGIITIAAAQESETTAATLGKEGVRKFNPMSNLDFLSIPLAKYIQDNIDFGGEAENIPPIFGVNYFLKGRGKEEANFLNEKTDKGVWLKWMELRSHGEAEAIETPVGFIPLYEDLERLFKEVQGKDYTKDEYEKQFTLRVPEFIAKTKRIIEIYKHEVPDTPGIVPKTLQEELERLEKTREKLGDYILPDTFLSSK